MTSTGALGRVLPARWFALAIPAVLLVALALVYQPFLATGVVVGGGLMVLTNLWPVQVIGMMLAIGPLDLSFITGGFKELFPELGGLDMNGIRLLGVSGGLVLCICLNRDLVRQAVGRHGRWYLLYLVYAAATIPLSLEPLEGARLLLKLAYPLLFLIVLTAPSRTRADLLRLADWVLVAAAVILAVNPFFVLAGGYEVSFGGWTRVQGLGIHENPFSFYLLVMLMLSVARFTTRGQLRYIVLALACIAWMGLTLTRITFVASLVGLGSMGLYGAVAHRRYQVLIGTLAGGLLLVVLLAEVVLVRTFGYVPTLVELMSLAQSPGELFYAMNWQGREVFWPVLFQAFTTSPWIGLGLGSSSGIMISTFPPEAGGVAHNEFLRLAVDTGILGVLLYCWAISIWFRGGIQAGREATDTVLEFTLPLVAGIMAWGVISMTDNAFDYYAPFTQFMGFLLAGALVAARDGGAEILPPEDGHIEAAPTATVHTS